MFREDSRLTDLCQGPLPPMACLDYAATMRSFEAMTRQHPEDAALLLDWMIRTLLSSLAADSASRIFLPRTDTAPFCLDDLLPFSALEPTGRAAIALKTAYVVAPVWNNANTMAALRGLRRKGPPAPLGDGRVLGVYLRELNLAVLHSGVHAAHVDRVWGLGEALLDTYALADLAAVLSTDGETWHMREADGAQTRRPVLEPRMAALYTLALRRYVPEACQEA